jgi:hypothetical protein
VNRRHRHPGLQLAVDELVMLPDRRPGPCRSRVSASSGNQPRTSSAHRASGTGGPPGRIPAAIAVAVYLRTVLRSTPRLAEIWFCDRPACQWIKISEMSITSKVLLAIGPPSLQTGRTLLLPDDQVHPDTHAMPMSNYVIGVSNCVIAIRSTLGNSVIVHTSKIRGYAYSFEGR